MDWLRKAIISRERGAALLIVLALVVLLTGVGVAYLSRTTSDRQVAHSSFNQSKADQLVASAMDNIIGDLRQEITTGSTKTTFGSAPQEYYVYTPTNTANLVPQRSGNLAAAPNLIRRSVSPDNIVLPGLPSFASAVNSAPADPANPMRGDITKARWNKHFLVPKANTTDSGTDPIASFTAPDWVFVTSDPTNQDAGRKVITSPDQSVSGRYAYAIYDESGLVDMNVAGYPTDPSAAPTPTQRVGRKGSLAYADLTALGNYPIPNSSGAYQVDKLVGWRNYATTQPSNLFGNTNFAANFQSSSTPATNFYNYVINNTSGFLSINPVTWTVNNNDLRTDQNFVQRQELIAFRSTTGFSSNALQYLSTFSRETSAPSFSPPFNASELGGNDQGGIYAYRTNAANPSATPTNPNFLFRRVTNVPNNYTRFDGTTPVVGEPLVKTRFPLSRLAWITYKGPSATLAPIDPVYLALTGAGVSTATIAAGTAANIQTCFGLTFGGSTGAPWTYSHGAANRILRLDEVAAAGREPDFFELLQAGILSGSLGQNTGGGVTGGNVFPDVHMSNTSQHILSIGAAILDQADPDSIPTRIQFNPSGTLWTAYGVESLPYINQLYPIAGISPNTSTQWATYLLFQLWNPHQNISASPPTVRLRVDGAIGIFTGGNGETWTVGATPQLIATGQSVTLQTASFSNPAPLTNINTTNAGPAPGTAGTFVVLTAPTVP
jgi:hypothetical protein